MLGLLALLFSVIECTKASLQLFRAPPFINSKLGRCGTRHKNNLSARENLNRLFKNELAQEDIEIIHHRRDSIILIGSVFPDPTSRNVKSISLENDNEKKKPFGVVIPSTIGKERKKSIKDQRAISEKRNDNQHCCMVIL